MTYHYTIPAIPPSLNRFAGRQNVHEYRKLKQDWLTLVKLSCRKAPPEPLKKAIVTITYFFPNKRRRDPDNYAGKMILDGLTAAGVIQDDCFSCIELRLCGGYDKENPRTEMMITTEE